VFVLRTNMKLSALAVVLRYRNLLAVEQSFLAARPCSPRDRCSIAPMPQSAALLLDREATHREKQTPRSSAAAGTTAAQRGDRGH
jgi:hypothetical protein